MATDTATTQGHRFAAIRHLSDGAVSTRAAEIAFAIEALTDAGPFGVPVGSAPRILALKRDLETLASETAAERPSVARTLRTAAADLLRAADADGPTPAYLALCDGLRMVEQL